MEAATAPSPSMPGVDGVTHDFVDAAGTRFHVAEAGTGDPVVLLHGWPQNWYSWRRLIPLLAADRRVLCPDLRGFGWSDPHSGPLPKQRLADDLIAILDALELDRVDLIAHDWGGWTGFIACLDHPERFKHFVPLNIPSPWPNKPRPRDLLNLWRFGYQVFLSTPGLGTRALERTALVKRMIVAGAVHRDRWTGADLEIFAAALRPPERARASAQLYRTFLLKEAAAYARGGANGRRLTVPTLMIHGLKDIVVTPDSLGNWQKWADDMAVIFRADSGHFTPEEIPEFIAEQASALFDGAAVADLAAAARTA